ncbi:UNKNOWN [Stylonychia lemnae]|uniref:Uncharacterized protein n=1 Tax=Stylonychia lemnae TaxID=5949 RepID=A0A078A1C4_STYLE|nr:UNKNOWN [Stylonychia lemnae]|eukprot:CDW74579.1 UNKNOWN [Stylonychia lemnae]
MDNQFVPLYDRVDQAIDKSDFTTVVQYVVKNTNMCKQDPQSIQRLLNNLTRLNLTDFINEVFQALIKIQFTFDSIEYVQPLGKMIEVNKTMTQINVLNQLIINKVTIDTNMIQKALEQCFDQLSDNKEGNTEVEIEKAIINLTKSVLNDPGKYLTQDFVVFLIDRFIQSGKFEEAEKILLDTRLSIQMYPELWKHFIDSQSKFGKYDYCIQIIDQLKTKSVSTGYDHLYNIIIEKFIQVNQRTKPQQIFELFLKLSHRKVLFTYFNQIETLIQIYQLKDLEQFKSAIVEIDYSLDPNAFNLIINLILDAKDFVTAIGMFELVFDSQIKKVDLSQVDVSPNALKVLLKIQTQKLKQGLDWKLEDLSLQGLEHDTQFGKESMIKKWLPIQNDLENSKYLKIDQADQISLNDELSIISKSDYELI